MSKQKNRGFVTIATGHRRYFNLARNLLHSYRQFATAPYPFAIITDRENEITSEFDDVIVISDPSNSYLDKLKLYRELPYDESIFIDADSLAYGDLNVWWEIFEASGDFSLFGYAHAPNSGRGWFIPSGMQEFSSQITFVPDFNGGVYYLRKSDTCRKVFEIANHCATHYHRYQFTGFSSPADEPVLALGMAVQGLEPINRAELVFAPSLKKLEADISLPKAIYNGPYGQYTPRLIH